MEQKAPTWIRSVIASLAVTILSLGSAHASLILNTNLISNAGFESGLTDWQSSDAAIRSADPFAYEGTNYVFGSEAAEFTLSQTIDLLSAGFLANEIDNNNLNIYFGGQQSGWNGNDIGQISISLLDSNMSLLGTVPLSPFTSTRDDGNGIGWQLQSGTTSLDSGTRFITFDFLGTKHFGNNNDAYLDDTTLEITAVPIPAAIWLFGTGLIGLAGIARRKKS